MELRTLKYFITVAREENMTRAAEILHLTQPALSKQIKLLEDEFGKKLFERHKFSIKLTYEGNLLCERATELLNMADKLVNDFSAQKELIGGEIFFGLAESYQIRFLARAIKNLKGNYPDLKVHITSGDTEQVISKLDKGLLDFAVLAETPNFYRYNFLQFPEADEWGLIIPVDDKLANKNFIKFEDLKGLPIFCSGQAWEREISEWCGGRINELNLEVSLKLSYNGAMFVLEGLGYLLSFNKLVDVSEGSGLVFRPLYPKCETKLYLVWKKYPTFSPIAEKFLDNIKKVM